jgi:hypothetical protein
MPITLTDFLARLSESGTAVVLPETQLVPGEGWDEIVREWDTVQRAELAYEAPDLSLPAAEWAALRLYRGCQALVCREMPPADLQRYLAHPCPEPRTPSVDYSADLLFRFLPDLFAVVRRVEPHDPLVAELRLLARAWPLSSVGIENLGEVDPSPVLTHPALRQLYVDRIVATGDTTRLSHPEVRRAVQAALGAYPELAPALTAPLLSLP